MKSAPRSGSGSKMPKRIRRGSRPSSALPKRRHAKPKRRLPNCWRGRRRCAPNGGLRRLRWKPPARSLAGPSRSDRSSPINCQALGDGSEQEGARIGCRSAEQKPPRRRLPRRKRSRVEAEEGRASAAEARDAAESQLASARAALSAARSEHDALARALEHGGGAAIASLKAEPGYERALAAALGEDAEAAVGGDGPRRWQGSEALAERSALPAGTECIADHADCACRTAAPASAGGGCRGRQRPAARGRPATGDARRAASAVGRVRRRQWRRRCGGALFRANRLSELAAQLPGLNRVSKPQQRSGTAHLARWSGAAQLRKRRGPRRSPLSAMRAKRGGRSTWQRRRWSGSRPSAAVLSSVRPISTRCLMRLVKRLLLPNGAFEPPRPCRARA